MSDWLLTEQKVGKKNPDRVYASTICAAWGMKHPTGADLATVQGRVYTSALPEEYNDAWVVRNAQLSSKTVTSKTSKFDHSKPFSATLVFVAGPNANEPHPGGDPSSTMRRTFNELAAEEYDVFRTGVAVAQYACLYAMAASGCDVAMLAYVSAALYAGPWRKKKIQKDYPRLLSDLLDKGGPLEGQPPLGRYFSRVMLVLL